MLVVMCRLVLGLWLFFWMKLIVMLGWLLLKMGLGLLCSIFMWLMVLFRWNSCECLKKFSVGR